MSPRCDWNVITDSIGDKETHERWILNRVDESTCQHNVVCAAWFMSPLLYLFKTLSPKKPKQICHCNSTRPVVRAKGPSKVLPQEPKQNPSKLLCAKRCPSAYLTSMPCAKKGTGNGGNTMEKSWIQWIQFGGSKGVRLGTGTFLREAQSNQCFSCLTLLSFGGLGGSSQISQIGPWNISNYMQLRGWDCVHTNINTYTKHTHLYHINMFQI